MEKPGRDEQPERAEVIKRLRAFARDIIYIAEKRDVPPPKTAVEIMDASVAEMDVAQFREPLTSEDLLYWRAVINQEYNEAIDKRYGMRPMPPGGIPLPPSPLERKSRKRFGGGR